MDTGIIFPDRSPSAKPLKISVLASGSGSNAQALIDAIDAGQLNATLQGIITDVANAPVLDRAKRHHIPARYISGSPFKTKIDGEAQDAYLQQLTDWETELVVLAGFMRIIKPRLLEAFPMRVTNIHPSLLPAFPGIEAWRQALEYGAKVAGCTVHFVDAGTDTGPIILQRAVPVLDDDTPASLHTRIQEQEHVAYPEAVKQIADGRLKIVDRTITCI